MKAGPSVAECTGADVEPSSISSPFSHSIPSSEQALSVSFLSTDVKTSINLHTKHHPMNNSMTTTGIITVSQDQALYNSKCHGKFFSFLIFF